MYIALKKLSRLKKMDLKLNINLVRILVKERELNNHNFKNLLLAYEFINNSKEYKLLLSNHLLTVDTIVNINSIILTGHTNICALRKTNVKPRGKEYSIYTYADKDDVENLIYSLTDKYNQRDINIDIFSKELLEIHPFIDGNGRTTRLLKLLCSNTS